MEHHFVYHLTLRCHLQPYVLYIVRYLHGKNSFWYCKGNGNILNAKHLQLKKYCNCNKYVFNGLLEDINQVKTVWEKESLSVEFVKRRR